VLRPPVSLRHWVVRSSFSHAGVAPTVSDSPAKICGRLGDTRNLGLYLAPRCIQSREPGVARYTFGVFVGES